MKTQLVPLSLLDTRADWHKPAMKVDDETLRRLIEEGGIQQPLIVLPDGKRFLVVDGIRRMKVARALEMQKVPVVVDSVPDGEEPADYARLLRFILDELRQDLRPSQRAELIETLKSQFGMNNTAVAQYLGIDQDSVTNWLAVRRYIPDVVVAMDRGTLPQRAARVFDGMSEKGQKYIWKQHADELQSGSGGDRHKQLRAQYPPTKCPDFYRDPDKAAAKLKRKQPATRKRTARPSFTPQEKRRLLTSLDFRDAELTDAKAELQQFKTEIAAATPIVAAIMRNERLRALVPEEMVPELERFSEVYV